jgi:hypothetical protein
MTSILSGIIAAVVIAVAAAYVLDTRVQREADRAFVTEGVRL